MRLIPEKETMQIEFKSDTKKYPDSEIFEAVVAFANTDGGELFLGVEDDGTITGLDKSHENPVTLSAYIANNTVPPVSVRTEVIDEIKSVIKIVVPKSLGGIVATASGKILRRRIKLDGKPENIPMYPTELTSRLSDLRLLDYSAMPVQEAYVDDFDPIETERLRRIVLAYEGDRVLLELQDEDLYKALGFVKEAENRLVPTIAGLLILGRTLGLKKHIPTHSASFQVLEGSKVKMNEDIHLPLLALIEKLGTYLDAWNGENEIEMGLFRMSVPDFNKRAIREAIVNAFSHRDYTKMGRVRICLSDEGLTIANPGGFIEGVTIDNLLTVEPHGRNPLLADALKRVGLAERTGRGIDRIFEGSLIFGRMLPDYSLSTTTTVSLLIPRCAPDLQLTKVLSDEQNRLGRPLPLNTLLVLNFLRDTPRSDIHQLSLVSHLSETIVKSVLDKAIEVGLVEAYGSGRGRTYMLSHKIYRDRGKAAGYVRQKDIDEMRYVELVISLASSQEYISRADVMSLLHVTEAKAYRILKTLTEEGKLEAINKGRYAKYKLI